MKKFLIDTIIGISLGIAFFIGLMKLLNVF